MIPINTKVVPDLLYYINQYVVKSTANKYKIPFPAAFPEQSLNDNKSFIRLLFDENWPVTLSSYRYLFREEDCKNSAYSSLKTRMNLYPGISTFYICDSDSTSVCNINLFNLQSEDLVMLDKLLQYRTDSTSVIIIDIDFSGLSTNLSKLIHIYLNFKLNNDYTVFDNTTVIASDDSVLENFYESFIVDKIFIYLSNLGT